MARAAGVGADLANGAHRRAKATSWRGGGGSGSAVKRRAAGQKMGLYWRARAP